MLCRFLVDLPGEVPQERVVDNPLVELRILAAAVFAWVVHKELTLHNTGRAERIRLDNVGTCLQKPAMNVANHLWLRQREYVSVIQQPLCRALEAFPADVSFRHAIGTYRRAHRSI